MPVYTKFKPENKRDKEIKRLLKWEKAKTEETKSLLRKRARLIKKLRILNGHLYANCCTIYVYWVQLNKGLPLRE